MTFFVFPFFALFFILFGNDLNIAYYLCFVNILFNLATSVLTNSSKM